MDGGPNRRNKAAFSLKFIRMALREQDLMFLLLKKN